MKPFVLASITLYQLLFSVVIKQLLGIEASCRFRPTCSDYMKHAVSTHGVMKGGILGVKRLLSCNPLTRYAAI